MLQILTATGARPEAWALCQRMMWAQDYAGPVRWIIVDDGREPQPITDMPANWTLQVVRPSPHWQPGQNTQARNLRAGLQYVQDDLPLAIVEDDDAYTPDYLSRVVAELQQADLVGQALCRKYSLRLRRAQELVHPSQASLCATAMIGPATRAFRRYVERAPRLIDGPLWRWSGRKQLYEGCHVVGVKCLPGRAGIDSGHKDDFGEIADPEFTLLRRWLGPAAEDYIRMAETMPAPQAPTRSGEIEQYVKAYRQPDYRMGVRRRAAVQALLRTLPKGSLLDVATGRGETLDFAAAAGLGPVQGTEVVPYLLNERVQYGEAHALPFGDGSFDHVTCFDCLEHLVEDDIRPALAEMLRVARRTCTVSVSERSDIRDGRELHISKRPRQAWQALIREVWGLNARFIGNAGASPMFQVAK
jgi:hypothetical protein